METPRQLDWRLILRGTLRALFSPRRARAYLSTAGVLLKDFKDWAQALTTRVSDAAKAAAQQAGRPIMNAITQNESFLRRFARPQFPILAGLCLLAGSVFA